MKTEHCTNKGCGMPHFHCDCGLKGLQFKSSLDMKKKIYVLTLSKVFMKGHPRAGEPTNFKEKFLAGEKIHTIREGSNWGRVVKEVNNGSAILSVREWSDKPYNSKQIEIGQLEKLGYQNFRIATIDDVKTAIIYNAENKGKTVDLAKNDGLSFEDLKAWFKDDFFGGIIHFTDFRY